MHEKLVGLEWTEIIMTAMSKIRDRGIRVDLERKSGWTSGVMSRISGFTPMAIGLLAKSRRGLSEAGRTGEGTLASARS